MYLERGALVTVDRAVMAYGCDHCHDSEEFDQCQENNEGAVDRTNRERAPTQSANSTNATAIAEGRADQEATDAGKECRDRLKHGGRNENRPSFPSSPLPVGGVHIRHCPTKAVPAGHMDGADADLWLVWRSVGNELRTARRAFASARASTPLPGPPQFPFFMESRQPMTAAPPFRNATAGSADPTYSRPMTLVVFGLGAFLLAVLALVAAFWSRRRCSHCSRRFIRGL